MIYKGDIIIPLEEVAEALGINYDKEEKRLKVMIKQILKKDMMEVPEFFIKGNSYYLTYLGVYLLFKDSNVDYHKADKLF